MKVSARELKSILCLMVHMSHVDGNLQTENIRIIEFLSSFGLSDEKQKQILTEAVEMHVEEAYEVIIKLDDSTKQEVSNRIFDVVIADEVVSDEEAAYLIELFADCELPCPDSQEWTDWCSGNESGEELLSNEDDEECFSNDDKEQDDETLCYFLIRPGDDNYGGKCIAYHPIKSALEEWLAKEVMGGLDEVLFEFKNIAVLEDFRKRMGYADDIAMCAYICKRTYKVKNELASELLGKTIYGSCVIRTRDRAGNSRPYCMRKSNCDKLFELLNEFSAFKLTYSDGN